MAGCLGILVASQQVGRDARRPGDQHAAKADPLTIIEITMVQPDVGPPRLTSRRDGELVPVGRQITEPVQHCRRTVRDNSLSRDSLPGQGPGRELEPCCPQVEVVGQRRAREVVDTVGDAFQHSPVSGNPVQGRRRGASAPGLASRDETPLILGDLSKRAEGCQARHYCNIPQIRSISQYPVSEAVGSVLAEVHVAEAAVALRLPATEVPFEGLHGGRATRTSHGQPGFADQRVLLSAQGMDVPAIAKVAFTGLGDSPAAIQDRYRAGFSVTRLCSSVVSR